MIHLNEPWEAFLAEELKKEYFIRLTAKLNEEQKLFEVFPKKSEIFAALNACPPQNVKVVLVGQDPYHGKNQAHGLSFSVLPTTKVPPSLKNIYKELCSDLQINPPHHGCLNSWAQQGVLLLNSVLTVRAQQAASHKGFGWEIFTDQVIRLLSNHHEHLVFLLWGAFAQSKAALIDAQKHLILEAAHPSPFSARKGFFGCKHFSKANAYLITHEKKPIEWAIPAYN